jgi:quercetin dioxygenase-like cupin family protein
MITEHQQDQASLYALGLLPEDDRPAFEAELHDIVELREFTRGLQRAADALALAAPPAELPRELKAKVMERIGPPNSVPGRPAQPPRAAPGMLAGLSFLMGSDSAGWKELPIKGAWVKLLSFERDRGYAVLLGKLDPGTRYPAHVNTSEEDIYVLTGDLHIGDIELGAGDFHHAERGSHHAENHSVGGCTVLSVLTTDNPLVAFAMA